MTEIGAGRRRRKAIGHELAASMAQTNFVHFSCANPLSPLAYDGRCAKGGKAQIFSINILPVHPLDCRILLFDGLVGQHNWIDIGYSNGGGQIGEMGLKTFY